MSVAERRDEAIMGRIDAALRARGWEFVEVNWADRGFYVWYARTPGGAPNSLYATNVAECERKIAEQP